MPPRTDDEWAEWVQELQEREPLVLNPESSISIKRDVHEVVVAASAKDFIDALHDVLRTPGERFGLIEVLRPPDRVGKPFAVGDRLQGRYNLEDGLGIDQGDDDSDDGFFERMFEKVLHWIEDEHLSDYGLVTEVELDPATSPDGIARFTYVYLDGTPIAGSTTFECQPLGPDKCVYRSIFVYQELSISTVLLFGSAGLKMHNQVILAEADKAAAKLGVEILSSTVPDEYRYRPRDDDEDPEIEAEPATGIGPLRV